MEEIWKDIPWYEGLYQVSNLGRVKSITRERYNWAKRIYKEKILKFWKRWHYLKMCLYKNNKSKSITVHRLVAQAFLWLEISNLKILVCHKDDNPINCNLDNLFLWTHKDNTQDMMKKWRNLFYKEWEFKPKSILQFDKEWIFIREWNSMAEASRELSVRHNWISQCCTWRYKSSWWYTWKYK